MKPVEREVLGTVVGMLVAYTAKWMTDKIRFWNSSRYVSEYFFSRITIATGRCRTIYLMYVNLAINPVF